MLYFNYEKHLKTHAFNAKKTFSFQLFPFRTVCGFLFAGLSY